MFEEVKSIVVETLQLGARGARFTRDTPLLGALPELDSMAVVTLITAIEERYGVVVDDDEISGDVFATLGALTEFVERKISVD
jgi:acyl carrier protein